MIKYDQLNTVMAEIGDTSQKEFINECLARFGTMNKNDYEVALFHMLLQGDCIKKESDFGLSLKLHIPEAKVKRLRYEVNINYQGEADNYDSALLNLMEKGSFKLTNDHIQFSISDKFLRLYFNNKLLDDYRFADSSFNSNIVSVTVDDLKFLLSNVTTNDDQRKEIIKKIKEKTKEAAKGLPDSPKEKVVKFSLAIAKMIGGPALESMIDWNVNNILDKNI